jgi:hypothetical protein
MEYSILHDGNVELKVFEVNPSMKGGGIGQMAIKAFVGCFSVATSINVVAPNANKIHFWSLNNFKATQITEGVAMSTAGTKTESHTCNMCGR